LECGGSTPLYEGGHRTIFLSLKTLSRRSARRRPRLSPRHNHQPQCKHTKRCRATALQRRPPWSAVARHRFMWQNIERISWSSIHAAVVRL